jgi:hypothetical protein
MSNTSLFPIDEQRRTEDLLPKLAQSEVHLLTADASREYSGDSLETVTECLTLMEQTVFGLQQLRSYLGTEVGSHMIAILIEEAEVKVSEIKRRLRSN